MFPFVISDHYYDHFEAGTRPFLPEDLPGFVINAKVFKISPKNGRILYYASATPDKSICVVASATSESSMKLITAHPVDRRRTPLGRIAGAASTLPDNRWF